MKYTPLVLSAMAAVASAGVYSNIGSYISTYYADADFYQAIVLGLQQDNTDDTAACYTSFASFVTQIQGIATQVAAIGTAGGPDNAVISGLTTNPYYMPGTYAKIVKWGSESLTVFFTFYEDCVIDSLLINFGQTINSISGLLNTATTAVTFILNNMDTTDTTSVFYLLDDYATNDSLEDFGVQLGGIITSIFGIQVPSVTYNNFDSTV